MGVDQRPAGITQVDGRVCLDVVLVGILLQTVTSQRRHDALRHRVAKPQRVADRQHHVAHPGQVGIAQGHRLQPGEVGFQYREVCVGVGADHGGVGGAPVLQHDLYGVRAVDDVVVGEYVALVGHDDTGTQGALDAFARRLLFQVQPGQEVFQ